MRGKAQRQLSRSTQTRLQNSGVTESMFTKFLSDGEGLSAMLTRAFILRFSHPWWNASAQNESVRGMPIF